MWVYQGAARTWLVLALLSLLLPASTRYGLWLPLHLALAGAVSVAISGAITLFSQVLTAGPPHRVWSSVAQFTLLNLGVAFAAVGFVTHTPWAVSLGGALFFLAIVVLAGMVLRSRKRGLNKRHWLPLTFYLAAIACVLVGAVAGALLGAGFIHDGGLYVGIRRAHQTLNVLGWASFAIVGTLITLFPSVLKVKMVPWRGRWPAVALIAGVFILAEGLSHQLPSVSLLGLGMYGAGALSVGWMLLRTVRAPRKHGLPITARHMLAGATWWGVGIVTFGIAIAADDIERYRTLFLVVFVGGWVLQTLVGTWLYLLPVWRPGSPQERARWVRAAEFGGWTQLGALNLGLVVLALSAIRGGQDLLLTRVGAAITVATLGVILVKTFVIPRVGRTKELQGA